MVIGERLRGLREQKGMSQGDVEKRTGLLRCYISRVENGHTVPSVDTLEKMARALEIPLYRLFTDDAHVKKPNIPLQAVPSKAVNTKQERELLSFTKLFSRMDNKNLSLLFQMASKMANRA
jgi:transcriptional regulator with XRE-family HTH domain